MLSDNVFAEPAKSSSMSSYIDDYANPDVCNDTNLGVAYFSDRYGPTLFLNVSVYSDEIKNPKLKINEEGDALLYLNTVDHKDMNDFEKYESTILFSRLNNLIGDDSSVINSHNMKNVTMADYIEMKDDFKIKLISRNKEKRENGRIKGKKYKYYMVDAEIVRSNTHDTNNKDGDLEFFDEIDLKLNKDVVLPNVTSKKKKDTTQSRNHVNGYYLYKSDREK